MTTATDQSPEDVIDFFLRLTQTELPRLVNIFTPSFVESPERQRLTEFSLETLIQGSRSVGLDNLAYLFSDLRDHLPRSWPMPEEARRRILSLVTEIRRLAESLEVEEGVGVYTGSRDLGEALDRIIHDDLLTQFMLLSKRLESIKNPGTGGAAYKEAADTAATVWQLLECSGNHLCTPLILMAADLLHRAANHHLVITEDLARGLLEGVLLVEQTFLAARTGVSGPSSEVMEAHLLKIRECIKSGGRCSQENLDLNQLFLQEIDPVLRETLTAQQIEELQAADSQGLSRVQVMVDMENFPDIAEQFIHWLPDHAKVVTNRMAPPPNSESFLFLLVTRHQRAELDRWFREIDPSGVHLCVVEPSLGG